MGRHPKTFTEPEVVCHSITLRNASHSGRRTSYLINASRCSWWRSGNPDGDDLTECSAIYGASEAVFVAKAA